MRTSNIISVISLILLGVSLCAHAEVVEKKLNEESFITFVSDEAWQPEGFAEPPLLHAIPAPQAPVIDGRADDTVWAMAEALTLPLNHGTVTEATLKAAYTEEEVFLLVSWPDASKDDQYHPWVWDDTQGRYVEGPQEEDGLLVSIEAGCDWNAKPLSGYVYDFDGWRWLAARSDPLGQAVDISGHVQDRGIDNENGFKRYPGRDQKPHWVMKLDGRGSGILTKPWQELNRWYLFMRLDGEEVFVNMDPDGSRPGRTKQFVEKIPAPAGESGQETALVVPQYRPVKLTGDAGEVAAKGYWQDGRWTVEYRRARVTPAKTATDSIFDRTTQFSLHVFDGIERVDEASESGRILLQFEPNDLPQKRIISDN